MGKSKFGDLTPVSCVPLTRFYTDLLLVSRHRFLSGLGNIDQRSVFVRIVRIAWGRCTRPLAPVAKFARIRTTNRIRLCGPEGPVVIGGGRGPRIIARHDNDLHVPEGRVRRGGVVDGSKGEDNIVHPVRHPCTLRCHRLHASLRDAANLCHRVPGAKWPPAITMEPSGLQSRALLPRRPLDHQLPGLGVVHVAVPGWKLRQFNSVEFDDFLHEAFLGLGSLAVV